MNPIFRLMGDILLFLVYLKNTLYATPKFILPTFIFDSQFEHILLKTFLAMDFHIDVKIRILEYIQIF